MKRGFSLVEVVVALGIFSVAVIGIFSLLGSAAESLRSSASDTVLVALTARTVADLRVTPFKTLFEAFYGSGATASGTSSYFREDGMLLSGTNFSEAFYKCTVKNAVTGADSSNAATATYLDLVIEFSWPMNSGNPKQLKVPIRIARREP